MATAQDSANPTHAYAMRLFCVTVTYDADVPGAQPDPFTDDFSNAAREAWERGARVADEVAKDILRWIRSTSRQPWLGIVAEPPRQYGPSGLYNASTGEGLMGFGPTQSYTFRPAMLALDRATFSGLMLKVETGEAVPVADALRADAWHLAEGAEVQDPLRALLIAGIASEIIIKTTMRKRINPVKADLFGEVLRRSSALDHLVNEVMNLGFGETLKASDERLNAAVKHLKEQRNQVVHTGRTRQPLDIRRTLATLDGLSAWLASHPTDQSATVSMATSEVMS